MQQKFLTVLVIVGWNLGLSVAWATQPGAPQPALTPQAAVRIQLDALRHNDRPARDAGIATVFAFASPQNREQTGPLQRFTTMIHAHYADMIGHRKATVLETQYQDDQAIQPVEVLAASGVTYRYLFILRRYELPQGQCWLTDGVIGKPAEAQRSAALTTGELAIK